MDNIQIDLEDSEDIDESICLGRCQKEEALNL